jgi:hypothetical protein
MSDYSNTDDAMLERVALGADLGAAGGATAELKRRERELQNGIIEKQLQNSRNASRAAVASAIASGIIAVIMLAQMIFRDASG